MLVFSIGSNYPATTRTDKREATNARDEGVVKATRDLRGDELAIRQECQPRGSGFCCAKPSPAAIDIDLAQKYFPATPFSFG